jgi:hypothetical protein
VVPEAIHRDDAATLAALGVAAYVCCDLLHELAGHGGVCLATGGRAGSFSAFHFQCLGGWQPLVCAAGILVNLAAGTLAWMALRWARISSPHARFFLWMFVAYNWFTGFGNLLTSSLANAGDAANAFHRTGWHWRPWMAGLGAVGYVLAVWALRRERPARSWRSVLIPYFAAAIVACAGAALNSILNPLSALTSAVSTTLGAWGFLLVASTPSLTDEPLPRSRGWMAVAAALTLVFVLYFGPGRLLRR